MHNSGQCEINYNKDLDDDDDDYKGELKMHHGSIMKYMTIHIN